VAAAIDAAALGQRDPLALALAQERPLELGEGPHHREHERGHRRILAGEGEVFLDEFDADAALRERPHDVAQVIEIARQAIHGMDDHRVARAGKTEQRRQLRPPGILAGRLLGEGPIDCDGVELSLRVLLEGADPNVPNPLPQHDRPLPPLSR